MSVVVNFEKKPKPEFTEQDFARAMINEALSSPDPDFQTEGLEKVLSMADKIVYFSGGVEKGDSRNVDTVSPESLIKTSGFLLYSPEVLGNIIRLTFDDNYIYDIYPTPGYESVLRVAGMKVLLHEWRCNKLRQRIQLLGNRSMMVTNSL